MDQHICEATLIVVAHPDDEVLGAGGTASILSQSRDVHVCILSGHAAARAHRPSDDELLADTLKATAEVGMETPVFGSFPNIRMNTIDHIDLVSFIETRIRETGARSIITHHPNDLNDDHRQVSVACQAAARLSQRGADVDSLKSLLYMEIPSSTDWAFPNAQSPFSPNGFVELTERHLQKKLDALAHYRHIMREYPHPRSSEVIRGLAAYRGGQAGLRFAEAFQVAYLDLTPRR